MRKRLLTVLLLLLAAWCIHGCSADPVQEPETATVPADAFLRASFPEDGSVILTCADETLTFAMGTFPTENVSLGYARIEVLSPGAVRAVFGDTSILFLEDGAESPEITADIVWGHVTRSHGAHFAVFPEAPSGELGQALEAEGMSLLIPAELGCVSAESNGREFFLSWSVRSSLPAMSAAK